MSHFKKFFFIKKKNFFWLCWSAGAFSSCDTRGLLSVEGQAPRCSGLSGCGRGLQGSGSVLTAGHRLPWRKNQPALRLPGAWASRCELSKDSSQPAQVSLLWGNPQTMTILGSDTQVQCKAPVRDLSKGHPLLPRRPAEASQCLHQDLMSSSTLLCFSPFPFTGVSTHRLAALPTLPCHLFS